MPASSEWPFPRIPSKILGTNPRSQTENIYETTRKKAGIYGKYQPNNDQGKDIIDLKNLKQTCLFLKIMEGPLIFSSQIHCKSRRSPVESCKFHWKFVQRFRGGWNIRSNQTERFELGFDELIVFHHVSPGSCFLINTIFLCKKHISTNDSSKVSPTENKGIFWQSS